MKEVYFLGEGEGEGEGDGRNESQNDQSEMDHVSLLLYYNGSHIMEILERNFRMSHR